MRTWRLIVTVVDNAARTEVETDSEAPTIGEVQAAIEVARQWVAGMRVPMIAPKKDTSQE